MYRNLVIMCSDWQSPKFDIALTECFVPIFGNVIFFIQGEDLVSCFWQRSICWHRCFCARAANALTESGPETSLGSVRTVIGWWRGS